MLAAKSYPGKKSSSGTLQVILSNVPKCSLFIDAMCGSGLVGLSVTACPVLLNDISKRVIDQLAGSNRNFFLCGPDSRFPLCCPWQQLVNDFDGVPGAVFYFDPPYLFSSRNSKKPLYEYEWDSGQHRDFLLCVQEMKSKVMISHYKCGLYDNMLSNWRRIEYTTMTRGGARTETLYMNFTMPDLLQCPQYVGKNFTDRQRIRRKVSSFIRKLNVNPPLERAAILSSIIDNFKYVIS